MKYALIIGCSSFGLKGPDHDVATMAETMRTYGFQCLILSGALASRRGILDAFKNLYSLVKKDDSIVLFFSSHGGVIQARTSEERQLAPYVQFLVTVPQVDPTSSDFCVDDTVITEMCLSRTIAALSRKTNNLTVILDCCFSARMVRTPGSDKIVRSFQFEHLIQDRARLFEEAAKLRSHSPGNPEVVRIAASGSLQPAYELNHHDPPCGALTQALCQALARARGRTMSWQELGAWVRERVLAMTGSQRPELEGPVWRQMFETTHHQQEGFLLYYQGLQACLRAGTCHGVTVGDHFRLSTDDSGQAQPVARVSRVHEDCCQLEWQDRPGALPPAGTRAVPVRNHQRQPTVLWPDVPESIRRAKYRDFVIRREANDQPVLANIEPHRGSWLIVVEEHPIEQVTQPEAITAILQRVARASRLRALRSKRHQGLPNDLQFEWGTVERGLANPQPLGGALLKPGVGYNASLAHQRDKPLYLNLFSIDAALSITHLNQDQRSGAIVLKGHREWFGYHPSTGKNWWYVEAGARLTWGHYYQKEHLVAVITDYPCDLSHWEKSGTFRKHGREPEAGLTEVIHVTYLVGNHQPQQPVLQDAPALTFTS